MIAEKWVRWDRSFLQNVAEQLRPFLNPSPANLQNPAPLLLVGVSGGADSLSLLHCLKRILGAKQLIVAHINHGLRPPANADADFVAQTAQAWGIPFALKHVDVAQLANENGWGVEEAGRRVRYTFFSEVAHNYGATAVSVAHNADDQAETLLMHLIRGSGVAGLRGMQTVGSMPDDEGLILLRPFLHTSRADIEKYCQIHKLKPREDESNQDLVYFRNQIRHELMPILENYNPQIKKNIQQLSEIVSADYDLLNSRFSTVWQQLQVDKGEGWLQLSREHWQRLPISQQRMALRAGILRLRPLQTDIGFQTIEKARALCLQNASGTQMDLPGNVTLMVDYQSLFLTIAPETIPIDVPQIEDDVALPIPGRVLLQNGWQLETSFCELSREQAQTEASELCVFVDIGEMPQLRIRGRVDGERMQPLGMDGRSTKLKDIMINRKITRPFREQWPIVVTNDHPVWLIGHVIDHRVQITLQTTNVIRLRCFQQNDS